MQDLYNALMQGETLYKDGGVIDQRAPTALMLRAARTIKQLSDTNDTNLILIKQLQSREQEWLRSIEINESKIDNLNAQLKTIIERGDSIDEIVKNLEDLPPVVEESEQTVDSASKVVEESTKPVTEFTKENNIFS